MARKILRFPWWMAIGFTSLFILWGGWETRFSAARSAPLSPASDQFGYETDDSLPYGWIDATSTISVTLLTDDRDNETTAAIPLGFSFPFYENNYDQVYISTNGLLAFSLPGARFFNNAAIPLEVYPNNFIAPFWDDLILGSGGIYTGTGGTVGSRYFLIEWRQVAFAQSPTDRLTFEALLYENGDILFQYKTLNGSLDSASVGIENMDGVDGLAYLYNSSGLSPSLAVKFARPSGGRIKVLQLDKSGFTRMGQVNFSFDIVNIGDAGPDTFDLTSAVISHPGWEVCTPEYGGVPMQDTDRDSLPDTGVIAQGAANTYYLTVTAPKAARVGDFTQVALTFASSINPGRTAEVKLQIAVPAPFASAYSDTLVVELGMVSSFHSYVTRIESIFYTGQNIELVRTSTGNYLIVWEEYGSWNPDPVTTVGYTNLRYWLYGKTGSLLAPSNLLIDNSQVLVTTRDLNPALAALPDDRVGILWVRSEEISPTVDIYDLYFGFLDSNGQPVGNPANWNITHNDGAFTQIKKPRLAVTSDSKLVLSWVAYRDTEEGEVRDIYMAIYDLDGNKLFPTNAAGYPVTNSQAGQIHYEYPSLAAVGEKKVWLAYTAFDLVKLTNANEFVVVDTTAAPVFSAPVTISGGGYGTVMTQLSSEKVLLVWTNVDTYQINYRMAAADTAIPITAAAELPLSGGHPGDYASIATDEQGNGIITWVDNFNSQLFYALVDSDGVLLTPPINFSADPGAKYVTSTNGQGNAPFIDFWQAQLPLISR